MYTYYYIHFITYILLHTSYYIHTFIYIYTYKYYSWMGHSTLNHGPWISNDLPLGALKKPMEPGSKKIYKYILPSFHMESPNKLQGKLSLKVRFISILKSCQILCSLGMASRHLKIWTTNQNHKTKGTPTIKRIS